MLGAQLLRDISSDFARDLKCGEIGKTKRLGASK